MALIKMYLGPAAAPMDSLVTCTAMKTAQERVRVSSVNTACPGLRKRPRTPSQTVCGTQCNWCPEEQRAHEQTRALLHKLDVAHAQLSAYALRVEELTMMTERQRIARDSRSSAVAVAMERSLLPW